MKRSPKYLFYATLLDTYQSYIGSSEVYQQYYGFSEDPKVSYEAFEQEQFQSLINRINRVPFDSEATDRGTAFNEVVDCLILNQKSEKMPIVSNREQRIITACYNDRTFIFPLDTCLEFSTYLAGATPQVYVEGVLPTRYGEVLLYGYIDELMPLCVHDIKTTSRYSAGKYRKNWQHRAYPFCLGMSGSDIQEFEYNVAEISKSGKITTYTEHYTYRPERDIPLLMEHCEGLIEFLHTNISLITDNKIINRELL